MIKKWTFRILEAVLLLFVTVSAVFFIMQAVGDGPGAISGIDIDETTRQAFIIKYGLNQSVYMQLLLFWRNLFNGSLGPSLSLRVGSEVQDFIWVNFGRSALFAVLAYIVGVFVGAGLAVLVGLRPNGVLDKVIQVGTTIFLAVPPFLLSIVFVVMASRGSFPVVYEQINPVTWILPVVSLAIPLASRTLRQMRNRIVSSLSSQYAMLALAKGVAPRNVVVRHLVRESLVFVVTDFPFTIIGLLVSAILVENVFSIPGVGRVYSAAITSKDYNVVLAVTTIMAILTAASFIVRDALTEALIPILRRKVRR